MVDTTEPAPAEPTPLPAATPHPPARWPAWAWPALAAAAIVGLIVSNVFLVLQVNDSNDEIAALQQSVDAVDRRVDVVAGAIADAESDADALLGFVGQLDDRVAAAESQVAAATPATTPATTEPTEQTDPTPGGLPVFAGDPANDPAVGTVIAELGGYEYYTGQEIGFDLADGRSRAIVVWAHWCPFCQDELPPLSDWITANGADLANVEILSITTAMDETAPNPLEPYLDESQFPFPVLVDDAGELSRLLGVDAFPFWIFLGPDGQVLGRLNGLRGIDELAAIFTQLDGIAAG